jgi:hypothetical protein
LFWYVFSNTRKNQVKEHASEKLVSKWIFGIYHVAQRSSSGGTKTILRHAENIKCHFDMLWKCIEHHCVVLVCHVILYNIVVLFWYVLSNTRKNQVEEHASKKRVSKYIFRIYRVA